MCQRSGREKARLAVAIKRVQLELRIDPRYSKEQATVKTKLNWVEDDCREVETGVVGSDMTYLYLSRLVLASMG